LLLAAEAAEVAQLGEDDVDGDRADAGDTGQDGAGFLLGDWCSLGKFRELAVGGAALLAVVGQIDEQLIDDEAVLRQELLGGQVGLAFL